MRIDLFRQSLLAIACCGVVVTSALAQERPQGLDSLDEDRVLNEIASRGMEDLLRHVLDQRDMPADERNALLSSIALSRLSSGEVIPVAERRQLVLDVVADVDQLTARPDDARKLETQAQLLLSQARLLIDQGVNEEVRLLEYFGENPDRRRYVRQVATAVTKMLEASATYYDEVADNYEDQISSANDTRNIQLSQAARLAASQSRDGSVFAEYYLVLSLDPDDPERINLAEKILEQVSGADRDDNPRRAFVQLYLGKTALARGGEQGLTKAAEYFQKVLDGSDVAGELFDARFFLAIVDAKRRNIESARQRLADLQSWFTQQQLPGHDALLKVLEFRVADAASMAATSGQDKQAASDEARAALVELANNFEGYRAVVTDQLLSRVDDSSELGEMSPLLLDALVDQGRGEAAKLTGDDEQARASVDRDKISRGIDAAREIIRRAEAGGGDVTPELIARNAFLLGLMLQLMDRPQEAAEAFLMYGELPGAQPEQTRQAYRRALGIVEELKAGGSASNPDIDAIEAKLLPVLVEQMGDTSRAFDLANRLHRTGDLENAAKYYAMVSADDPRKADAVYLRFLAEAGRIAAMESDSQVRARLVAELPEIGQNTVAQLTEAMNAASGPAKSAYRERLARVNVALARFYLTERNDGDTALGLLGDIEQQVAGLDAAESILGDGLPLRFQATAAKGDIDAATADLLALLERSNAQRGLAFISDFRETLNRAYRAAEVRQDEAAMLRVMQTRAQVTPKLVEWIDASDDPEYRRYAYNFRRFDAETQLQEAEMIRDPAQKATELREAKAAYEELAKPANVELYRELLPDTLTPAQRESITYDRQVIFALGEIAYQLDDFTEARSRFARLLADRAMGEATVVREVNGVSQAVPNEDFWATHLRFMQSNLKLGNATEQMRRHYKQLQVIHGDAMGGQKYKTEYTQLAGELGV